MKIKKSGWIIYRDLDNKILCISKISKLLKFIEPNLINNSFDIHMFATTEQAAEFANEMGIGPYRILEVHADFNIVEDVLLDEEDSTYEISMNLSQVEHRMNELEALLKEIKGEHDKVPEFGDETEIECMKDLIIEFADSVQQRRELFTSMRKRCVESNDADSLFSMILYLTSLYLSNNLKEHEIVRKDYISELEKYREEM